MAIDPVRRHLLLPIIGLTIATISVVGGSFYFAYRTVDTLAEDRQGQTLRNAITQQGQGLERELRAEVVWADAFKNTTIAPDAKWMNDYYGSYLSSLLGYDEVYVLNGSDQPIYGFADGQSNDGRAFEYDRGGIADLVAAIRAPDVSLSPYVSVTKVDLGNGKTVEQRSISNVRLVGAVPANVVIETIVPDADLGNLSLPVHPALLVATYNLDSDFLRTFGNNFHFGNVRWAQNAITKDASTLVTSLNGTSVGAITWTRDLPGQEILRRMAGGFVTALALLGALAVFAIGNIRRRAQRLVDSERREAKLARTDFLTGLPNRLSLSEEMTAQLKGLPDGRVLGVLSIDLDGLRRVNDAFGHQPGDGVLVAVGARLKAEYPECFVARTGGDEFVMLVPAAGEARIRAIADRVVSLIDVPLEMPDGLSLPMGCSIGYAVAPFNGADASDLLRRSDLAVHMAKKEGRGRAHPFDDALEVAVMRRRAIEGALRKAVAADAIDVAYQPLMSMDGGRVLAVEALARWTDPELGSVSPVEFIPVAEETGLIVQLGEQILRKSMTDAHAWPEISISVNVSAQQIQRVDMVGVIERLMAECRFPADRLEIELTESVLVGNDQRAEAQISALQKLGVKVALDDFGTGYASLLYLRQFGFDKLKIDRNFVKDSDTSVEARAMVISITSMSRALGLDVTAEGVENQAQHDFLRVAGCDRLQGYLFSKPISAAALSRFLGQQRSVAA